MFHSIKISKKLQINLISSNNWFGSSRFSSVLTWSSRTGSAYHCFWRATEVNVTTGFEFITHLTVHPVTEVTTSERWAAQSAAAPLTYQTGNWLSGCHKKTRTDLTGDHCEEQKRTKVRLKRSRRTNPCLRASTESFSNTKSWGIFGG